MKIHAMQGVCIPRYKVTLAKQPEKGKFDEYLIFPSSDYMIVHSLSTEYINILYA